MKTPILSVIGHTNVGKTSLMRTLLRDAQFGEVKNESATTKHVEAVHIFGKHNKLLLTLHDTPGLEDASGVMDFVQAYTNGRDDGIERLLAFLSATDESDARLGDDFSQEAKVIRSLIQADIAIYVIDAREPVLPKYKDELAILAISGTPVLPVFNFIKGNEDNMQLWRLMLSRRALYVVNTFDTVAFDFDGEMALWQNLATLSVEKDSLNTLQQERQESWQDMAEEGSLIIADFLVNVASFSKKIDESQDPTPTLNAMQNAVRQSEDIMQEKLLHLYQFYNTAIDEHDIEIQGREQDIFDGELLARHGIRTAGGSITGMVVGAGIDVATLGASLGLGTALGGIIGGLLPNTNAIRDKALGIQTLTIDDATLTLLATRAQNLHHALRHRGHASLHAVVTDNPSGSLPWQSHGLPTSLKKARAYPHYSSLDGYYEDNIGLRQELSDKLSITLLEHLSTLD
ncbi:DUF3482 domain-containing protein [Moraxella sp. ZY200743]|uniref:DUF3482 domain-containing protein n=1 Tax=Moraxella sp. ZY200743 TaxID=2911970 RepID=UPI003D7EBD9B